MTELLCQIDSLDETIEHFDQEIDQYVNPFEAAVVLLDTIPGVGRETAELLVSEIGTDMSHFPTANHLAAWAGLVRARMKVQASADRDGHVPGIADLRAGLVQAAHAAVSKRNNYLAAQYHRLVVRRGKKKAALAVAHSILVIAYHLITRNERYHDLGADYYDRRKPEATAKRLLKRLEKLGYQVNLQALVTSATA